MTKVRTGGGVATAISVPRNGLSRSAEPTHPAISGALLVRDRRGGPVALFPKELDFEQWISPPDLGWISLPEPCQERFFVRGRRRSHDRNPPSPQEEKAGKRNEKFVPNVDQMPLATQCDSNEKRKTERKIRPQCGPNAASHTVRFERKIKAGPKNLFPILPQIPVTT